MSFRVVLSRLAALLVALTVFAGSAHANLITNGEFSAQGANSRDAANWTEQPLAGGAVLAQGAKRVNIAGEWVMRVLNGSVSQTVTLAANTIYEFSFDVAGLGFTGTWSASIGGLVSATGAIAPFTLVNDSTHTFATTTGGTYDVVFAAKGAGIAAFDDVQLNAVGVVAVPGPEVGVGLPVLIGAAVIWWIHRRRKASAAQHQS